MHIDEDLLKRVMEQYGFVTKTEAVEAALMELDRQNRYEAFVAEPCPFTPDDFGNAVAPGYDPLAMRVAEKPDGYGKPEG